jgi:SAM-dependent methyltransferase
MNLPVDPESVYPREWVDRARRINWYHTFALDHGVVIEGQFDLRPHLPRYGLPENLEGWSVLDVGASNGFFSFEFERRGADRVVAVDLPTIAHHDFTPQYQETRSEQFSDDERAEHDVSDLHGGFYLLKEALNSRVEHVGLNVYDLTPEAVGGTFDLVFCGSLLIHLSDPFRALQRLRTVTRRQCVVATVYDPELGEAPVMKFVGVWDGIAWWKPSAACLEQMMKVAGFTQVTRHHTFELVSRNGQHADPTVILHGTVD